MQAVVQRSSNENAKTSLPRMFMSTNSSRPGVESSLICFALKQADASLRIVHYLVRPNSLRSSTGRDEVSMWLESRGRFRNTLLTQKLQAGESHWPVV